MISLFYLGLIPGSFFWGWFADHYGRKTAMLAIISGIFFQLSLYRKHTLHFWFGFFQELLFESAFPFYSWHC